MNFLELCQATAEDSGTIAGLPSFSTVNGATGRLLKLVNWVRNAWIDIQNERTDWLFRRKTFEHALIVGTKTYTAASLEIDDFGAWMPDTKSKRIMSLYDPDTGQSDEQEIRQIPWDWWRQRYDRGTHDQNRPGDWAMGNDRTLNVGPTPDKAYILRGEYRRSAQRLVADGDTPIMPEDFHRVIVQEALRLMARSDEALQVLVEKSQQYDRLRNALVIDQTPEVTDLWGSPLA